MSVTFTTRLIDRKEDSTEDWFKKSFWNILAQDYIIGMSCSMLVVNMLIYVNAHDNILIIISFVRTNLSRAPDKASHIHMRERKEKVLASLRDKMS